MVFALTPHMHGRCNVEPHHFHKRTVELLMYEVVFVFSSATIKEQLIRESSAKPQAGIHYRIQGFGP